MNGNQYFEENPWLRAVKLIREKDLGPVHEIIATPVVKQGELEETLLLWKQRAEELAGKENRGCAEKNGKVIAYLGNFGNNTLVRFFIDAGAGDLSENFEIVTEKSLLVWKPIGTNQGHISGDGGFVIQANQKYVADLQNGPSIFGKEEAR